MDIAKENPLSFKVLMIPWLAHSHVSSYLQLAKILSNTNIFSIYFCSTPIILRSIDEKVRISMQNVQLVELHLPSLPELPPHLHTMKGLPPHLRPLISPLLEMAVPNFASIFNEVNPDLIMYDNNLPFVPSLASSRKIPSVHFQTSGATPISYFYSLYRSGYEKYPFPSIFVRKFEYERMSSMATPVDLPIKSAYTDEDRGFTGFEKSDDFILLKTSSGLEGEKIDFLSNLIKKTVVPVGPLVQENDTKEDEESEQDSKILEWLSKKEDSSTVFVSFGSEYFLTKEEMEEIALGLELSNVDFIWVIRFPVADKKTTVKIDEELPEGFLERVKERAILVDRWAPQSKILQHPSIGGFVSHCGWGSVMESISFGVPIIAIPMQYDQPLNARLLVEQGVAKEVIREENGELRREEVARVIREVVVEKKSSEEIKRKARELSENVKMKGKDEVNDMVKVLVELCQRKNQLFRIFTQKT